jgi:acyl carrier protein
MANRAEFQKVFEQVLRRHLRLVALDEPIRPDSLLTSAGLDSVGTINLLLDLEDVFSVSLPGSMLRPETFRTRSSLESAFASLVGDA